MTYLIGVKYDTSRRSRSISSQSDQLIRSETGRSENLRPWKDKRIALASKSESVLGRLYLSWPRILLTSRWVFLRGKKKHLKLSRQKFSSTGSLMLSRFAEAMSKWTSLETRADGKQLAPLSQSLRFSQSILQKKWSSKFLNLFCHKKTYISVFCNKNAIVFQFLGNMMFQLEFQGASNESRVKMANDRAGRLLK